MNNIIKALFIENMGYNIRYTLLNLNSRVCLINHKFTSNLYFEHTYE